MTIKVRSSTAAGRVQLPLKTPPCGYLRSCSVRRAFAPWPKPGLSRWDSHRFDDWQPLRPALVCEVSFSRRDGHFLRHSARFVRWRPDKDAAQCTLSSAH